MNQASLFDDELPGSESSQQAPAVRPGAAAGRRLVIEADGGSRGNPGPAGYGALVREGDVVLAERAEYLGIVSNNVAEYSGLIAGLTAARQIDPTARVEVRMDSKLVVEQMSGRWKIKHEDMRRLARHARDAFLAEQVTYTWVPRAENAAADALANQVMDSGGQLRNDFDAEPPGLRGGLPADGASDPSPSDEATGAVPDIDAGAPSLARTDVLTLVLLSPGTVASDGGETADVELSEQGIELATGAAALVDAIGHDLWPQLAEPSSLLSSPLVRAQQTAQIVSEITGLGAPVVDPDLARAAAGETSAQVAGRVEAAVARLIGQHAGRTVVVAAHADVIAAVVGLATGLASASWSRLRIAPGTVSVVRSWAGGGEVHALGCPAQLGGQTT